MNVDSLMTVDRLVIKGVKYPQGSFYLVLEDIWHANMKLISQLDM
jgi:hypothetical protein